MSRRRHHAEARQPLSGWWGHARPFAFEQSFDPSAGIRGFQCGTQPMLSMRALKGALDVWDDVDMAALRAKSIALTDLFIELVEAKCGGYGLELESPRDGARARQPGLLRPPHAYEIMQALISRGVVGDFRATSTLRFGFTPLYVGFKDVWQAVEVLEDILRSGAWKNPALCHQSGGYVIDTAAGLPSPVGRVDPRSGSGWGYDDMFLLQEHPHPASQTHSTERIAPRPSPQGGG